MPDLAASINDATVIQEEEHQIQAQVASLTPSEAPVVELPGYQLVKLLGQGSFGEVWAGVQLRTGQTVAIKIITAATSMNWRYLEHEVARLRQVAEHPHVVTLLDADLQHAPPYFVMTLHAGTLQGWSAVGKADGVETVVRWLSQMARALQFTHSRGLLHCDLKPSNVLLDEEGLVRLSDFGQSVGRGQPAHSLGSLGFMGPEQACREAVPEVGWDVYGLGATVYALLTGHTPRLDEQARQELATLTDSTTKLQRYQELLQSRPLLPVRSLNAQVDQDLAEIVEACLVLDASRRTSHMGQILEDLQRRQERRPLLCRRPWTPAYRLQRLLRQRRKELVVAGLVALCLGYFCMGKMRSDQAARTLLARQEWEQGWSFFHEGREGQALLWWARQGALDSQHALALGQSSAHLTRLSQFAEPATSLAFAQDGRLLVASESQIRLGDQIWQGDKTAACQDLGPYRITRQTAGFVGPNQLVGRLDEQLWQLTPKKVRLDRCHGPLVVHEGQVLYSDGQSLRVYGSKTQQTLTLPDSAGPLEVGALNQHWAARARGGAISVWDLKTGRALPIHIGHEGDLNGLCLSPDGRYLASAGTDNRMRLWELPAGRQVGEVTGKMMMISGKFSPDGKVLVSCNYDGTVQILRTQDLSPLVPPLKHRWLVYGVTFSPSGRLLATRSIDGTARVWELASGRPVSAFLEHANPVRLTAFSADERQLATAALDGTVRQFALHPEQRVRTLQPSGGKARWGAYSPDGSRAAVASGDQVLVWDVKSGKLLATLPQEGVVNVVCFSPDGRTLVTAGQQIRRWDAIRLTSLGAPLVAESEVYSAQISGDSHWLASGGLGGEVHLWELASGKPGPAQEGHGTRVTWIEFAPDGQRWVTCCGDTKSAGDARLRDLRSQKVVNTMSHPTLGIQKAIFSPDGSRLFTCGEDASGRWWDAGTGQPLPVPAVHHVLAIWDAAWAPDGSFVVTASGDSTLQTWDLNGTPLTPPLQHDGPVVRVEVSGDGQRIVSSSKDGSARVWEARTGQLLMPPVHHEEMVFVCRLSPDNQQLLTAANNGCVQLFDLSQAAPSAAQLRQRAEKWTGLRLTVIAGVPQLRALSAEEWQALP